MTAPILSHVFPNGLVLLAQPMDWLQSAAFSFLVPAGCVYEPASAAGTGLACLRNDAPRGRPARQPAVRSRPGQSGRRTPCLGLQHAGFLRRGHAGREPARGPGHFRRRLAAAAPAGRGAGGLPPERAAKPARGRRRAFGKGHDRTPPPPFSRPLGPLVAGRGGGPGRRSAWTKSAASFSGSSSPAAHSRRGRPRGVGAA